ncbi:MAG TPA: hypothetical protein VFF19_06505, partial [Reyranella sp.]|nr:hypothetical protein [Reyranella sp.]
MLLNLLTQSQPYDSVQSVARLIGSEGLTSAEGLPILVDMAIYGGQVAQIAAGQEFGRLLAEHATTTADLHSALYVDGVSNQAAAIMLAAAIDPDAATIPAAVLELIAANVRLPQGAESWQPYIQPLIAALSAAVISEGPVLEASGLRLGQAVLAISAYARVGDPDVMHDAGVAIAALATFYHATDSVFALLSRALVSGPQYSNNAGRQIAEVGVALGFTPEQTTQAVANGIDHGLAAADVINVLARLTSFDSASFGLVSGAAIAGLTDGQFTSAQAMDVLLGLTGVSANNMMLLLAGFAGAGTAADQIAVGRAIAYLPSFDPQLLPQIPDNAVSMVALGIASSGAPDAETLLLALSLQSGEDLTAAMMAALAAAADAGTLSGADGVRALAQLGVNVANLQGDEALTMRTALHEGLVDLVRDHLSGDVAAGILLTSVPVTSVFVEKMRAEAGGMLAALVDAALASTSDITAALSASLVAGTNTPTAIAAFIAGAALNREYTNPFPTSHELAKVLGDYLGELIETGSIGISDAMSGVAASHAWFRMGDLVGETTMLATVAAHDAAGLQAAVGHALVAVYQSDALSFMPAFDALVGVPDGLTADKAKDVLIGMADGFQGQPSGLGGLYAVASELAALNARGALTAQEVADGVAAEIAAGNFPTAYGLTFLAYWVAADASFAGVAAAEIGELMAAGLTATQVIDGLLGAPRPAVDDVYPDPPVTLAVARIIGALGELDRVTYAHAANAITAAEGQGSLATANAAAILLGLAETADESDMAFLAIGFRGLIERGLDPAEAAAVLNWALDLDLVTHEQASSFVGFATWAIAARPDADLYMASFARTVLARTDPAAAVAAVDRVYELGLVEAEDVASLLTYMHDTAGTHSRWAIGQELWKMFDDGGYALADIFGQVVAHNPIYWMQGSLIGAMAATPTTDVARQAAVGNALGEFIAGGGMSFSDAMVGVGLTQLQGEQYTMLLLGIAGGGGAAEQIGIGQHFGHGLAGIPVDADDVDLATVDLFYFAVGPAGLLTVPDLVGVLIGVGMAQFPSPYAVRTSAYALNALVTDGRITAEDAMALIEGMVPLLSLPKLVHWFANASTLSGLHYAVAIEIAELVADGVLSATQALGYIREMTNGTPQDTAALLAISRDTAADLVISIAGHGDSALQDAVGTHLATLVLNGSYLPDIAAAVTDGSLSAEGAVHVIANLVAALASDPSATVRNWASSQLDHYVDAGLVDTETVSSVLMDAAAHATTGGLQSLGVILGALGGGLAAIGDA